MLINGEGSGSEKRRKLTPILLDLKANDKMVRQLKFTLEKQRGELARVDGQGEEEDDDGDLFDDLSIHSS
jgi:hypothetical protein